MGEIEKLFNLIFQMKQNVTNKENISDIDIFCLWLVPNSKIDLSATKSHEIKPSEHFQTSSFV